MVGNLPNFTGIDILRCFLRINKGNKTGGRQALAKELGLGEGTIRTILNLLKSKKLLESTKKGHFLSKNGTGVLSKIHECISAPESIAMHGLYPGLNKIGVLVRNAPNLKKLYRLRDIAVRNGADGAIILKFNGGLYAPESDSGRNYSELEECFDFRKNDALVIAFSGKKKDAENGAIAIAAELSSPLKRFISSL